MIRGWSKGGECRFDIGEDMNTIMSDLVVLNISVVGSLIGDRVEDMELFDKLMEALTRELRSPIVKRAYKNMLENREADSGKD